MYYENDMTYEDILYSLLENYLYYYSYLNSIFPYLELYIITHIRNYIIL